MINYIDTHTHLYDEAYDCDFKEVVARMRECGVLKCILPGIDSDSFERQERCAEHCGDLVVQAMGLHPTSVKENWKRELDFVLEKLHRGNRRENLGADRKYVAVGEIGLDGYWSTEFMEQQMEVFQQQLRVAAELDLPVIIHLREATEQLFNVLDKLKGLPMRGVFHAFSGSVEMFERIRKYGTFSVGIGGVVTYKNASVAKALEQIPLEYVLLETDAPWLTPVPYRGKRNESSYIQHIAAAVAIIKGCTLEEVAQTTTQNAKDMFGL